MDNKNFAWPVTSITKSSRDKFYSFVQAKKTYLKKRDVAIFGAGIKGNEYGIFLDDLGVQYIAYIDNNNEKQGGYIEDHPIVSLESFLNSTNSPFIFIAIENGYGVAESLKNRGLKDEEDYVFLSADAYDCFFHEFKRRYSGRYLFFGDCMFDSISIKDIESRSLEEMCRDEFGFDDTKVLAMHGLGMRAYYEILKAQIHYDRQPDNVFLEVNLLTFTRTRHLLPRSQHIGLLEGVYNISPSDELLQYIELCKERFSNYMSDFYVTSVKSKDENVNEDSLKQYIRLNYMYRFNENTEGVQYLKMIIDYCQKRGIKLQLFIPPANYMLAERLYGDKFYEKYNMIRNSVIKIVNDSGETISDWSILLKSDEFCMENTPDETANYKGRMKVLEKMMEWKER